MKAIDYKCLGHIGNQITPRIFKQEKLNTKEYNMS